MELTIRKMQPGDIPAVLRLLREFAEYEKLSDYCTATEEGLNEAIFGETAIAEGIVATEGENLSGYAIFYPNFSSFRSERGLYLEDIYLSPQFRGGGGGRRMLAEIARLASGRGFKRIDFQVLDWNTPAIEFYKKLGAVSNDDETHFKFSGDAFLSLASENYL